MAREYARTRTSTADDPDLEMLSIEAHWLYFYILLPHPSLSSCGVMDWRPKRLVRRASNATLEKIRVAAAELERARYLMFDLETEEVLLRTYVRGDELLKNPKMAGAVIKGYAAVGSRELQAALVSEIARDREDHPEYSSWDHKDTGKGLARILSRPDLSTVGYTYAFAAVIGYVDGDGESVLIADPIGVPNGDAAEVSNGDPEVVEIGYLDHGGDNQSDNQSSSADDQSDSVPIPSTRSPKPAPLGGHPAQPPHLPGTANGERPPPHCPDHPGGTPDSCGPCAGARKHRERLDAEESKRTATKRAEQARVADEDRAHAIAACDMCRTTGGYIGTRLCSHNPAADELNRRGLAGARIAICKLCDTDGHHADGTDCDHKPPRKTPPTEGPLDAA